MRYYEGYFVLNAVSGILFYFLLDTEDLPGRGSDSLKK